MHLKIRAKKNIMKIKFKKNRLYENLLLGVVWTGIGILNFYENDNIRWSNSIYLVLGLLYTGHFLTDITYQYLTIENGTIQKNRLYGFGKKINLIDINWIKKINDDYTLITDSHKLKIKTKLIEENSRIELNTLLEQLNLPSEEHVFAAKV